MNILVIASTFPRFLGDHVPSFIWDQVLSLKLNFPSLSITVLAPHDKGAKLREVWNDIEIYRYPYFYPAHYQKLVYTAIWPNIRANPILALQIPFLFLGLLIATFKQVRRRKYDVVYSHWFVPQGIVVGFIANLFGIKHVFTTHASDILVMRKIPVLGRWLVRKSIANFSHCTAVSERSFRQLNEFFSFEEMKVLRRKFEIISMGVDYHHYANLMDLSCKSGYLKKNSGLLGVEEEFTLLFIGRLAEKKGVTYLLQAVYECVYTMNLPIYLIVAGDGPLESSLRSQAESLNILSHVAFVGYKTGSEKDQLLASADAIVLPSVVTSSGDAEGMPVAIMEAMASGRICITTDVSGGECIIEHGRSGYIVREKNVSDLVGIIKVVFALDHKARILVQESAKAKAAQYDWGVISLRYYKHFFHD